MKIYAQTSVEPQFTADLQFKITEPASGFSFCFGNGSGSSFITGLGFSGRSGYLFDQSGNFFGGYKSGQRFDLKVHCFSDSRASYFYDGVLMANDISVNSSISSLEFDKIGDSNVVVRISSENYVVASEDPNAIKYNNSTILYNGVSVLFT